MRRDNMGRQKTEFRKTMVLAVVLVVLGGAVSLGMGADLSNIVFLQYFSGFSWEGLGDFFTEYWYLALLLASLVMYGWSHMHGEGYNEVEFD